MSPRQSSTESTPAHLSFFNVNTQEDLDRAHKLAAREC